MLFVHSDILLIVACKRSSRYNDPSFLSIILPRKPPISLKTQPGKTLAQDLCVGTSRP